MPFEVIETYDEESLLDGLMDVHVKYANNIEGDSPEKEEAAKRLAAAE